MATGDASVAEEMLAAAQEAVDLARGMGVELDFSGGSIERVEGLLAGLHRTLRRRRRTRRSASPPAGEDLETMAMAVVWGAYVGEVIRRRWGGAWTEEAAAPWDGVLALRVGAVEVFPPAKLYKRLTAGPADDVWFYTRALRRRFADG